MKHRLILKMLIISINAFINSRNIDNYNIYWNSSKIRSYGNCCSLISNYNLSTAKIKKVLFGFTNIKENMLLFSGKDDLNSSPDSKKFDMSENYAQSFMEVDNLLNNTRSDYNELVYERRDLSYGKYYKKIQVI